MLKRKMTAKIESWMRTLIVFSSSMSLTGAHLRGTLLAGVGWFGVAVIGCQPHPSRYNQPVGRQAWKEEASDAGSLQVRYGPVRMSQI